MTPLQAIKEKCLDCSCGSKAEVKECPIADCSLFPFRFGHHPKSSNKYPGNTEALKRYKESKK